MNAGLCEGDFDGLPDDRAHDPERDERRERRGNAAGKARRNERREEAPAERRRKRRRETSRKERERAGKPDEHAGHRTAGRQRENDVVWRREGHLDFLAESESR